MVSGRMNLSCNGQIWEECSRQLDMKSTGTPEHAGVYKELQQNDDEVFVRNLTFYMRRSMKPLLLKAMSIV